MPIINQQKVLRDIPPAGEIPGNRELFRDTFAIAWPSIVESFLVSLVGFFYTMLLGTL